MIRKFSGRCTAVITSNSRKPLNRTPLSRRRSLSFAIAAGTLLASAAALQAHDFWLVPNAFRVAPDAEIIVRGQTSSRFPTSEAAVSPERVADARVVDASGSTPLPNLSVEGKSLRLRFRPTTAGQKLIAVTTRPRTVRESAQSFRRYLELEGVPELLARYEREGELPRDSVTRRYAKTLVEVGDGGPRVFEQAVGHPVEFVPLRDPAALRVGDTLAVRLLYRGQPLAGARIHAGEVPMEPGVSDEQAAGLAREVSATTDPQGVARVPVESAGLWNVRTLHIVPADAGPGADWDAHWATLVFGVAPGASSRSSRGVASPGTSRAPETVAAPATGAQSDSATVAATVERFHRALSSGDTALVMELLTADAVILESSGIETRAEYRSHHLPGDIAFARAVPRDRGPMTVRTVGDVAWASSTSTAQGTYRDRETNSARAELVVLTRTSAGWKIAAIHWSSRPIRPQR